MSGMIIIHGFYYVNEIAAERHTKHTHTHTQMAEINIKFE